MSKAATKCLLVYRKVSAWSMGGLGGRCGDPGAQAQGTADVLILKPTSSPTLGSRVWNVESWFW